MFGRPSFGDGLRVSRALVSVSDKRGIVEFVRALQGLGVEIISTGGTAKILREAGIGVIDASQITGFPEMMDGRVKTLHPRIHGGILAVRKKSEHIRAAREHGIPLIDMVVVNLYPFEETVKRGAGLEEAVENIDIGGPAMVRSAAKNFSDVAVVVDPDDYCWIIDELKKTGEISESSRRRLAVKAFSHTARYDTMISSHLNRAFGGDVFPEILNLSFKRADTLRYGENPHQRAVIYTDGTGTGIAGARCLQGKQLSFNNYLDLDAAWDLLREFEEPSAVIIKHGNPCGVASAENLLDAYRKAHACDPVSAYGGVVGVNRAVDDRTAAEISSTFIEAVVSPDYSSTALEVLSGKPNMRILKMIEGQEGIQYRQITGGMLAQDRDSIITAGEMKFVTKRKPSEAELSDLIFAWKVAKHVRSNAIVLAKDRQSVGIGAGQMSRVDSAEIAIKKAGDRAKGSVMASDGFIPFKDTVEKAAAAEVAAIIQPGGSIRDSEIVETAEKLGISMVLTGTRHFRH
ncbi:MAG: bifunctional phosphoribosylaminoimidazolecarboxamide formyltransferase/IMP cyclohydrolase [Candidatus Hadarchaeales archaeon]